MAATSVTLGTARPGRDRSSRHKGTIALEIPAAHLGHAISHIGDERFALFEPHLARTRGAHATATATAHASAAARRGDSLATLYALQIDRPVAIDVHAENGIPLGRCIPALLFAAHHAEVHERLMHWPHCDQATDARRYPWELGRGRACIVRTSAAGPTQWSHSAVARPTSTVATYPCSSAAESSAPGQRAAGHPADPLPDASTQTLNTCSSSMRGCAAGSERASRHPNNITAPIARGLHTSSSPPEVSLPRNVWSGGPARSSGLPPFAVTRVLYALSLTLRRPPQA